MSLLNSAEQIQLVEEVLEDRGEQQVAKGLDSLSKAGNGYPASAGKAHSNVGLFHKPSGAYGDTPFSTYTREVAFSRFRVVWAGLGICKLGVGRLHGGECAVSRVLR